MHPYYVSLHSVASPGFPERLKKLMKDADFGTIKLAERSGVNKDTIRLWRKGEQKRYIIEKVAMVAPLLGTTPEELLELPPPPQEEEQLAESGEDLQADLLRRIASLAPVIERLPELEELVIEAGKLSEE